MSKPQNILGKFNTYAYHHILMVCNSTATAEALSDTIEITSFQHPRDAPRYSPRIVKGVEDGKYVTLIDGTTDARFYITEARWSNIIAADPHVGDGNVPQSTTMHTEGEMEIVEPLGAAFLNRLTDIADVLDTDPVGLIFLLKTIFVGHTTNGGTEMITSVRPFMFIVTDISAIFDSSGAKYKVEFCGLTNGVGQLPAVQKIFEGLSFKYGPTLEKTFENIAEAINYNYGYAKQQAIRDYADTLDGVDKNVNIGKAAQFLYDNYRDVKYKIISRDYTGKNAANFPAGDLEIDRIADSLVGTTVNYGKAVSIEEILDNVMASSSGVIDDSKKPGDPKKLDGPDAKYIYKIISTLKSTATEYTVEYHVNRYLAAVSPYVQQQKDGILTPLPGQSIEFDYIFTGKNVDIKNFDIKMEMGMAFFQIAGTSNNIPSQNEAINGTTSHSVRTTGSSTIAGTGIKRRGKSPLFFGTTVQKPISRNTTRPIDSAGFQALLERHASLENVSATMTIYGNPQLLDELTILPSEVAIGQTEKPTKDATVNPRWMSTPTLLKVNIRMPVDTNDVNTEYEQFWYSGYYNLISVDNIFEDGEFTQELGMFSIPISDATETVTDKPKPEKPKPPKGFFATINQSIQDFLYDKPSSDQPAEKKDIQSRSIGRTARAKTRTNSIKKKASE